MKRLMLLCLLLILISTSLFAQYNDFKDKSKFENRQRAAIRKNKIKKVYQYFYSYTDTLKKTTNWPQYSIAYNKNGSIAAIIYYKRFKAGTDIPTDSIVSVYTYNTLHQLTDITLHAFYDQERKFEYNNGGRLVKETRVTNIPLQDTSKKAGYTITYKYNKEGYIIEQKQDNVDAKLSYDKHYRYNKRGTMLLCNTKMFDPAGIIIDRYSYVKNRQQLTKTIKSYKNNALMIERKFVFDSKGNQIKGYEIQNGNTKTVWAYNYGKNGQILSSLGGPVNTDDLTDKDIRRDGLTKIFYTYDAQGNVIALTKRNKYMPTSAEYTFDEKLIYTTN
ncbi:hypothetical protein ACFGVR_16410 [Mucilaginibacter sp. AW1-3]